MAIPREKCFAGEEEPKEEMRAVQKFLFEVSNLTGVFGSSVLAALDWLNPAKDNRGDLIAIQETREVYQRLIKGEWQLELL